MILAVLCCACAATARSTDLYWTGATNGVWDNSTENWTDNPTGTSTTKKFTNNSSESVTFGDTGVNKNITFADNIHVTNMTVTGTNYSFTGTGTNGTYLYGSGTLTLNESAIFDAIISNFTTTTVAANKTLTLQLSRSTQLTFAISGAGGVTKSSTGSWFSRGVHTYTGATTITGGTLGLLADGSIAASSGLTVEAGATFDINSITNTTSSIKSLSGGGAVTLGAKNLTIGDGNDSTTFSGIISGNGGSLTKDGSGTLTLSGANTYSGGTTVTAGTLQIGDGGASGSIVGNTTNNAAVIFNRSNAVTYAGNMSGAGTLEKKGDGTLTLTGANTHTGGTTVTTGTLQIGNGTATGSIAGAIANNAAVVFNRSDAVTHAGAISGNGSLEQKGGGTLTLTGALGSAGTYAGNITIATGSTLAFAQAGDQTLSGTISGETLKKEGSKGLTLSGEATLTLADIDAGALNVAAGKTLTATTVDLASGATLGVDVGSAPAVSTATFTNVAGSIINITGYTNTTKTPVTVLEATNDIARNYTVQVGGQTLPLDTTIDTYLTVNEDRTDAKKIILDVGLVWNNNKDNADGANAQTAHGTFNIASGAPVTIGATLEDNLSAKGGTGYDGWNGTTLTKLGDGTLVLTGTNTFTGGTDIKAGTVSAANTSALGSGPVAIGGHGVDAVLDMNIASPAADDGAALSALAGRTDLKTQGAFNLNVAADYTLTDGLSFVSAAAGSSVRLNSPDHTVTLAAGKSIDASAADFAVGVNTTLVVAGASSVTAANAIFDGILDLPASSALTVNGNATLPAGGSIKVGATTASDIGKLHVGGDFTIADNGGAANIFFGSEGKEYKKQPFLTADGGIVGGENLVSNFFKLKVNGDSVLVGGMQSQEEILDNLLDPAAITSNLHAGAAVTDQYWDTLSPELQDRIEDYTLLLDASGVPQDTVSAAFRQLYGEYAAYSRRAQRDDSVRFQSTLMNHIDRQRSNIRLASALRSDAALASYSGGYDCSPSFDNRIWGGGFGSWTEQDSRHGTAGYEYKSGGVILGYDHAINDNLVFGFAAAYSRGKTDVDDLRTRYDSDTANAGVYAAWFGASGLYAKANAGFGYGWNDYDTIMFVGGGKKKGKYHTQALTASAEFGREWSLPCDFTLTPSIGVDFAYVRNNAWTESTTGNAVSNRFASGRDVLVDIPLTARVGKVWVLGNGRYIMPEASVSYIYSAADREEKISASYAGAPFAYNQKGVGVGRSRIRLGASVKARLTNRADASLDYTFETRTGYRNHNLSVAVGWSF